MRKIVLFLLSFAVSKLAFAEVLHFECGENCEAELNEQGVLTVKGSGVMDDFSAYGAPWFSVRTDVKNIVVEEGVTTIGKNAFFGTLAENIFIPSSVENIGDNAFTGIADFNIVCAQDKRALCEDAKTRSKSSVTYDEEGNKITSDLRADVKDYQRTGSGRYVFNGKMYSNLQNMQKDKEFLVKKIYTVDEASRLSKTTGNKFSIRYK